MSALNCSAIRSEISIGDPDAFAQEMAKLINTKEYRSVEVPYTEIKAN